MMGAISKPQQVSVPGVLTEDSSSTTANVVHPTHPPQPVLPDDASCPVDWTLEALRGLPPRSIESYLLRTPWKAKSEHSTEEVRDILNAKYNKTFSAEAWRKRSRVVNQRVYLATGMWWKDFTTGLDDYFEVKQKDSGKGKDKSATIEDATGEDEVNSASRPVQHKGQFFTILANDEEGVNFRRYATLDAASAASELFANAIKKDTYVYPRRFDTTRRALDRFLSCFMPQQQANLSTSGCELVARTKGMSLRFLELDWTISDLFQVFHLADELGSHKVCNMVLNAWRKLLRNEEELRDQYQRGERNLSDPTIKSAPSILDFKPTELNKLSYSESTSEVRLAAQDFWVGVLVITGDRGLQKISENKNEYSQEILAQCNQRLAEAEEENCDQQDTGIVQHLEFLLNGGGGDFCREYHVHAQDEVCTTPALKAETIVAKSSIPVTQPAHHVKLSINGIPGFTVRNYTHLDNATFKTVFAESHWEDPERIRSVHDHVVNRREFEDFRDFRPVERPVYFQEGMQDENGRWPSHPGYNNPSWELSGTHSLPEDDHPEEEGRDDDVEVIDFGSAPQDLNNDSNDDSNNDENETSQVQEAPEEESEDAIAHRKVQEISNRLDISDRVMASEERDAWRREITARPFSWQFASR
jgi:hypothetical protein